MLSACGGSGGGSSDPDPSDSQNEDCLGLSGNAQISGSLSYDFVPVTMFGLRHQNTSEEPIRQATVQLVDECDDIIASTASDDLGNYQFSLNQLKTLRVRVLAETRKDFPGYAFQVVDNSTGTNSNNFPLYSLVSSTFAPQDGETLTRNLHAESGWSGSDYSGVRAAAPFAILDTILLGLDHLDLSAAGLHLEFSQIRWSPSSTQGSFYQPGDNSITLLGDFEADSINDVIDTDEFDRSVVLHEFGHLLEANISRSDSVGGRHLSNQKLDLRLAYSEAFGDALASEILGTQFYLDSGGAANGIFVQKDLSQGAPNSSVAGWFNTPSIANVLYEFSSSSPDAFENLLTSVSRSEFRNTPALISIFSVAQAVKENFPETADQLNELATLNEFTLEDNNQWGSAEENNGDTPGTIPVYKTVEVNGAPVELCVTTQNRGEDDIAPNKLGFYAFARANIDFQAEYIVEASLSSGIENSRPQIRIFQGLRPVTTSAEGFNSTQLTYEFEAGQATLEVFPRIFETNNVSEPICFNLEIRSQ